MADYVNVHKSIGFVVSKGLAKLHELDSVYGSEDLWDLIEVAVVDAHNERILAEKVD